MQRIGVFVCWCGSNIAGTVDVHKVAETLKNEAGVVFSTDYQYMCSQAGQDLVKNTIKEYNLTGVVICSCSPRMHENTFRKAAASVGLNPYMVEIANIREQCSWIHKDMATATEKAIILGRAARNEANIKNRQPLSKLFIQTDNKINADYVNIILEELNIKDVELTKDASGFISYNFKPQMRTMGPKYGKLMRPIFDEIAKMDGAEVMETLNSDKPICLNVQGTDVEVFKDDVLIDTQQKDGFVSASDAGFTVVLDTNLTDELIEEGFVREIISKIQTMRKDSGFEVTDRISVVFDGSEKIAKIFAANDAEIKSQTLADSIDAGDAKDGKNWNVNGEKVDIAIQKA